MTERQRQTLKSGLSITAIVALVSVIVAAGGFAFNFAYSVSNLNSDLDRNLRKIEQTCRAVVQLDADVRYHDALTTDRRGDKILPSFVEADC